MKKEKIKLENIKEKEISNEEKEKNEKETKKNKILLYTIPLILVIINAIIYFLTNKIIFLILFGIILFIFLFGWDGNSRVCPECNKWNGLVWTANNIIVRKTKFTKKNIFGKIKQLEKKERIIKKNAKCKNCGKSSQIEKKKRI